MIYFDCFLSIIVFFYLLDPFMIVVKGKTAALPFSCFWALLVAASGASYLMGKYLPMVLR